MYHCFYGSQSKLCAKFMEGFREILENEKLNPNTRAAVKGLVERRMREIEIAFDRAFMSELEEISTKEEALKEAEAVIKRGEKFPSPQAREAVSLWHELVDDISDTQERRNAILSAGSIIAAFLQTYYCEN